MQGTGIISHTTSSGAAAGAGSSQKLVSGRSGLPNALPSIAKRQNSRHFDGIIPNAEGPSCIPVHGWKIYAKMVTPGRLYSEARDRADRHTRRSPHKHPQMQEPL